MIDTTVTGGADSPTAVYVSRSAGDTVLLYFAILLVVLALAIYVAAQRGAIGDA